MLLKPESYVRLEPMDDVRGGEVEVRGILAVGEDGRIYAGGTDGGSGRRLGVRMRTLREDLGAVVCLDVLPEGEGEGGRLGVVRVGDIGGGDGVERLGGGIESVDLGPAASSSNSGRSPFSLSRTGSTAATSRTRNGAAGEPKFGDSCRISSIDPKSALLLGAVALSFSFSPSVCASAEGAALLSSLDVR